MAEKTADRDNSMDNFSSPAEMFECMRGVMRARHMSYETEKTYLHWVRRFIHFHQRRHPAQMGEREIVAFLTHLAVADEVSASTQRRNSPAAEGAARHERSRRRSGAVICCPAC